MIKAKSEMTENLVTVRHDASLDEAYILMFQNKFRHLPVTGDDGEIISIISDRDLQKAMDIRFIDPDVFRLRSVSFPEDAKVSDYMSLDVKKFNVETDVRHIMQSMIDSKISAVLITKEEKVAGILTTEDLLKLLMRLLEDKHDEGFKLSEVFTSPFLGRMGQLVSDAGI